MQPEHSVRPDQDVLFAWREGLDEARPGQDLKQQLLQREGELLPRFAEHYDDLTHLPRSMRRRLQRHWKRSLAGIALLLVLGQAPAMAATINVGGACTLVRAIVAANNDTTANGHCKKGSGADTIVLPLKSTQKLTTINNTDYGGTGLPTIRSVLTIDGNGSTIKRVASAPKFRIFAVAEMGNLRLQEATVSGGVEVSSDGPQGVGTGGGLSKLWHSHRRQLYYLGQ